MKAEIIQRPSDEDLLKKFLESPHLETSKTPSLKFRFNYKGGGDI